MKEIHFVTPDEAVSSIESGDHIHLGSCASVPHVLVDALVRRAERGEVEDLHFHHFHTEGPAPYSSPDFSGKFFEQGFFVGQNVRADVNAGYADYIPVHLIDTQKLYRSGAIKLGAALVQVSLPDENGMVSLGASVDCSPAAIETARLKVAVVNPNVPFAYGELIPLESFDFFVKDDTPLFSKEPAAPSPTDEAIGKHCAELVQDGACLQMGIGGLPNAICAQLAGHKDLGIHTEMFSDGVLGLIRKGVVTGRNKKIDCGKVVASFLLGSQDVYSFIDRNQDVKMREIGYVNDPWNICRNPKMTSVNSAVEVDLTGQVCADSIGTRIFSGTGGQLDFVRGAVMSEGGVSMIALSSRTAKGAAKIVPVLHTGAGVVTPRADVHWIVTEYGAVDLWGRSLQERARLLVSIAHPDDRESLERAAFERFGPHLAYVKL